jgi:hypothetical protein
MKWVSHCETSLPRCGLGFFAQKELVMEVNVGPCFCPSCTKSGSNANDKSYIFVDDQCC